jgi:fatty acid desaturase
MSFYCLGFIGAAIYYIALASDFWKGVLGFLKALVWPAFLVYGLLKFLASHNMGHRSVFHHKKTKTKPRKLSS